MKKAASAAALLLGLSGCGVGGQWLNGHPHPPAPVPGAVGAPTPAASAAPAPRWKWDLLRPLKAAEAAEAVVMGEEEGVAAATTGREE